jgi:hypothetical protein
VVEARLAVVETHVEYMRAAVDEIRATQLEIRDAQLKAAAADHARKSLVVKIASVCGTGFGLVGSGVGWLVSHGKIPLALALLLYAAPVSAQRAPQLGEPAVRAWVLKIKACPQGKGMCKMPKPWPVGSQAACEIAERSIREALPLMPPGLNVTLECLVVRDETIGS